MLRTDPANNGRKANMNPKRAVPTLMKIARDDSGVPPESLADLVFDAAKAATTDEERQEVVEGMQSLFGEDLGSSLPKMTKSEAFSFLEMLAGRKSGLVHPEKVLIAPLIITACARSVEARTTDATKRQVVTALEVLLGGNQIVRETGEIIEFDENAPF